MTILVTGANGQLGNEMRIVAKNSEDRYIFTDVVKASEESIAMLKKLAGDDINTDTLHLDITKLDDIKDLVKKESVNVIVNCAAYTNVDAAESNQELAELLNAKAPENLALAIKEVGGLLIHISTDYVFGGDPYNTPCKEDQKGTPTGVYGLTKLHGEQNIISTLGESSPSWGWGDKRGAYVIIRTAWLYSEFGKNFVKTMLNLTASKPQLKVVFDQVGTPTYALDLATSIIKVTESYKEEAFVLHSSHFTEQGIYHFSNEGVCSWFDFTKMISEYADQTECDIQACHSDEFPSPVKRPAYSVLDKSKVKNAFGVKIPYWTDSLKKCIKNIKAQ